MTRQEANIQILERLQQLNSLHNDLRFGQLLLMAGIYVIGEKLFEESTTILKKIKE